MSTFENEWTLETALKILQHPTVDSKIWAEAVEWLLIYGPPSVREALGQASNHATNATFPELHPKGYDTDGSPCYSIADIARVLDISEEEAAKRIEEKQAKHGMPHLVEADFTNKLQ